MRFRYLTPLLMLILLLTLLAIQPAYAQETMPTLIYQTDFETFPVNESCEFDYCYGGDDNPWRKDWDAACGVDGSACIQQPFFAGNGNPADLKVFANIGYYEETPTTEVGITWEACVINYVEFDLWYTSASTGDVGTDTSAFTIVMDDDNAASLESPISSDHYSYRFDIDFADLPNSLEGEWFHVALPLDNDQPMDAYAIRWRAEMSVGGLNPEPYTISTRVDNLQVWCDYPTDALVRPFALEDENPQIKMFDRTYAENLDSGNLRYNYSFPPVYAFSSGVLENVHSAVDGEISSLRPVNPATDCESFTLIYFEWDLFPDNPQLCYMFIPEEVSGIGNIDKPNDGNVVYRVDLTDVWLVTVDTGVYFIDYLITNPTVGIGDAVNGGCVLGASVRLMPILTPLELDEVVSQIEDGNSGINDNDEPLFDLGGGTEEIGFTALVKYTEGDTQEELYPSLLVYPSNDNPCGGVDDTLGDCITGDPGLYDAMAWQPVGPYTFDNPGFTLSSVGIIRQILALDDSVEYSMVVRVRLVAGPTTVTLRIGETAIQFHVTDSIDAIQTLTLPAAEHEADLTDFWTVSVQDVGPNQIQILSVCVIAGDPPELPASSCYFANPGFDTDNGWEVSSGVVARDGSLGVPDGETVSQEITLPAGDYTLSVKTYVWYDGTAETRDDTVFATMGLDYEWDGGGPTAMTGPDGSTLPTPFGWWWARIVEHVAYRGSYTADFTVASETTATLTVTVNISSTDEGIYGAGFDLACIRVVGDDSGDPDDTCTEVVAPQDENLSSWTVWGWQKLNGFFQCQLMPMLTKIKDLINQLYQLTGWQIRYWKAVGYSATNWMSNRLFPWLNGHFRNMAIGNVTVIQNGNAQCDWVQVIIGVITGGCGATGLFDLLNTFFSSINATIQSIFSFLTSFFGGVGLFDLISQIISQLLAPIINTILNLINIGIFLLFDILLRIVQTAFYLFNQAIALIGVMFSLFYGLIAAYNAATPQTIPGVPSCVSNPQNSSFCMMLWVAEHTVFSDTGILWIPLTIAFGAIRTVFWSIREFKAVLNNSGAML